MGSARVILRWRRPPTRSTNLRGGRVDGGAIPDRILGRAALAGRSQDAPNSGPISRSLIISQDAPLCFF